MMSCHKYHPMIKILILAIIMALTIHVPHTSAWSQTQEYDGYGLYKTVETGNTPMWFHVVMLRTDSGEIMKAYLCKEHSLAKSYKGLLHVPGCVRTESSTVVPVEGVLMGGCSDCDELDSVYMEYGIKNIIRDAFSGCTRLHGVRLPPTLESIGTRAFEGCTSLSSIEMPEHVQTIHAEAFAGCSGIRCVKVHWGKPIDIGSAVFKGCQLDDCTLIVPRGTAHLYRQAEGWREFGQIVEE